MIGEGAVCVPRDRIISVDIVLIDSMETSQRDMIINMFIHILDILKVTEMQAAIGFEQLKKLPSFVEKRVHNWNRLYTGLEDLEGKIILPEATVNTEPSWFGFLITTRKKGDRDSLAKYLEKHGIQTRMLFAGNLLKHPCFAEMKLFGTGFRIVGNLINTNIILNDTFWIGVYPGLTDEMIDYMTQIIHEFFERQEK